MKLSVRSRHNPVDGRGTKSMLRSLNLSPNSWGQSMLNNTRSKAVLLKTPINAGQVQPPAAERLYAFCAIIFHLNATPSFNTKDHVNRNIHGWK